MKKTLLLLILFISFGTYSQTISISKETDSRIVINQFIEGKMNADLDLAISSTSKASSIPELMEIKGEPYYVNRYIYAYHVKKDNSFNVYEIIEWFNKYDATKKHITLNYMNNRVNNSGMAFNEKPNK